jgi:hypothetical protein
MPFPRSFTTTPFQRSSTGRFEANSCKPAPGGQLPSSVQHQKPSLLFVTHCRKLPFPGAQLRLNSKPQERAFAVHCKGASIPEIAFTIPDNQNAHLCRANHAKCLPNGRQKGRLAHRTYFFAFLTVKP